MRTFMIATAWAATLVSSPAFTQQPAAGRQVLTGHMNPAFQMAPTVGKVPDTAIIYLAIGLPARDAAGLAQLARDVFNPKSANYRAFLTPARFAARYGANAADYRSVLNFAQAHGLKVTDTFPAAPRIPSVRNRRARSERAGARRSLLPGDRGRGDAGQGAGRGARRGCRPAGPAPRPVVR